VVCAGRVALPIQFSAQSSNRGLLAQTQQSPQTQFNGLALRL
jgi:hypothetical protein